MIVCPAQEAVGYTGVMKSCEYMKPILTSGQRRGRVELKWEMLGQKALLGKRLCIYMHSGAGSMRYILNGPTIAITRIIGQSEGANPFQEIPAKDTTGLRPLPNTEDMRRFYAARESMRRLLTHQEHKSSPERQFFVLY